MIFLESSMVRRHNCSFICKIIGELKKHDLHKTHVQKLAPRKNLALKIRYSEKAKICVKIFHFEIIFLSHFLKRWEILSNFVTFPQYLNFEKLMTSFSIISWRVDFIITVVTVWIILVLSTYHLYSMLITNYLYWYWLGGSQWLTWLDEPHTKSRNVLQ